MNNMKGFTLAELIIVITMIGILSSIAVPSIASSLNRQRVVSAGNEVRGALQTAKSAALKEQTDVEVRFTEGAGGSGEYSVVVDGAVIKRGSMPKDVVLYNADFSGQASTRFNAMGFAYGFQGEVRVRDEGGRVYRRVTVTPVGVIRLEKSANGQNGTWN